MLQEVDLLEMLIFLSFLRVLVLEVFKLPCRDAMAKRVNVRIVNIGYRYNLSG